jgi:two-component system NtrC family sensor kinase
MKLAQKLALFLIAPLLVVLVVNAGLRLRREAALIESESERAQQRLAMSIATAIADNWADDGVAYAERLAADLKDAGVRFVAGNRADADAPRGAVESDGHVVVAGSAPVVVDGVVVGAVHVRDVMLSEERYLAGTVWRSLVLSLLLTAIVIVVAGLAGARVVGAPLDALVVQARRIGRGELDAEVTPTGNTEIATLSAAFNAMAEQLRAARARTEAEARAKDEALAHLRRADRLATIGKLSAGLAHELGTPLNVVIGRADLIATGEVVGDEAKDNARVVVDQAQRMSRIIRQLLDFARPRPPQRQTLAMRRALDNVQTMLAPFAKKAGVEIVVDAVANAANANVDVDVDADHEQLDQILVNLTMNAIQALAPGGTVSLRADVVDAAAPGTASIRRYVRLCVKDDGPGIAPDVLPRVFDPFFTTKPVGEGTGLGLAVTHGLVEEHGGFIVVDTAVGRGTSFCVHLPQRAPEQSR